MTPITALIAAQRRFDSCLPIDNRNDAEIENDALERAREGRFVASPEAVSRYEAHQARIRARRNSKPASETPANGEQKTSG